MTTPALAAMPTPSFIVIGAQKGGTHWIRDNLSAHPDVFMPAEELQFFSKPTLVARHGLDGYRQLFAGWRGQAVVGEATPGYLMWHHGPADVARSIHALLPEVRLVAVLRDPVARARSALVHFRRNVADGEGDLAATVGQLAAPEDDPLGLVTGGWYASSLRPFLDTFGDQLLVLLTDDLRADPCGTYDRLLGHVGLAAGFRPPDLERPRFSFDPERFGVRPVTEAEHRELFAHFAREVDELEALIGRDLDAWRHAAPARPRPPTPAPLASPAAEDLPGHAPGGWPAQLTDGANVAPRVVERPDGTTFVIEGHVLRKVASTIVARALRIRYGRSDLGHDELRGLLPGPPVVLLKTPGESAFVVVGGRRMTVPGVGTMLYTDDDWYTQLDVDPPLDVLRAATELQEERRGTARPGSGEGEDPTIGP